MTKYGNRKTEIDGILFASGKEARRYCELKLLERAGEIEDLRVQPKYELQPKFKRGKKTERAIIYIADFAYREAGRDCAEDVKGGKATRTAVFEVKRKMLLFKFPDLDFRIV